MLASCGGGSSRSSSSREVTVSWNANGDHVVNTSGGGYTLYYSQQADFDVSSASKVDVPYVSGPTAPISTKLMLSGGDVWYVSVAAYGILNGSTKSSDPSAKIAVNVGG